MDKIDNAISFLIRKFESFREGDSWKIIDPDADKEIGSHYALSHYMAAFFLLGFIENKKCHMEYGYNILSHILETQKDYSSYPDYHNDFNNFVWALLLQLDFEGYVNLNEEVKEKLKDLLFNTKDSNHDTVNWLCMRAFNNRVRFILSKSMRFEKISSKCLKKVFSVVGEDGYIEDRLPKGYSANFQYHIFSLAILILGQELGVFEIEKEKIKESIRFTLATIAPDGDCNYIGRGCNQIFAWGPMLFILDFVSGKHKELAESFFYHNFLSNKNSSLLLENADCVSFDFLWDYHYVSVYQAHLMLWLSLKKLHIRKIDFSSVSEDEVVCNGLVNISKGKRYYWVINNGTKHYLCEQGPSIAYLGRCDGAILHKGEFGPYFTPFGNRVLSKYNSLVNSIGVYVEQNSRKGYLLKHKFPSQILLEEVKDSLKIVMKFDKELKEGQLYFPTIPTCCDFENNCVVSSHGKNYVLKKIAMIQSLYGWRSLYASPVLKSIRELVISIKY